MRKSLQLSINPMDDDDSSELEKSGTKEIDLDSMLPAKKAPADDEGKSQALDVHATILAEIKEEEKDPGFGDYGDSSDDSDE